MEVVMRKDIALSASLVVVAALGACAEPSGYRDYGSTGSDYYVSSPQRTDVVYVEESSYPTRTYIYEPSDVNYVYFYESSRPDYFTPRRVYRDRGRSYYVEYDGNVERRVVFNDRRARERRLERRVDNLQDRLRDARERDRDRLRDWEDRHDRGERRHR
jgi:hypothetical protein